MIRRTLHGVSIDAMSDREHSLWMDRYAECLADALGRGDRWAADLYRAELAKLAATSEDRQFEAASRALMASRPVMTNAIAGQQTVTPRGVRS